MAKRKKIETLQDSAKIKQSPQPRLKRKPIIVEQEEVLVEEPMIIQTEQVVYNEEKPKFGSDFTNTPGITTFDIEETSETIVIPNDSELEIKPKKSFFVYLPWILLAIFIVCSVYFWLQLSKYNNSNQNNPNAEITSLVEKVGKIVLLPEGDLPQIATINDLKNLVGHPFFMNAKVGDKVLIYSKDKKVIMYRPSTNMIIEVTSLNVDIPAANSTSSK
jgi:hypothetical protein